MAVTLSAAATQSQLKGACDAVVDLLDVGGVGSLKIYDGAVLAVTLTLPATAFGAATLANPSVATAAGLPLSGTAVADVPAADNFEACNNAGTVVWSGTVTATGGGGDVELDNVIIANGMTVTMTAWTYTQN